MQKLLALLLTLSVGIASFSQSSIKGTVKDTTENKNLTNTAVALLTKKDSVLVKFTRADKDGNFSMTGLKDGQFILMVTHPYMGDFFDAVELKPNEVTDLGKVFLTPKSKLLAEVIIKSGAPIRIKGDTTIYTADSFKVRPGANVEELLKKLPGIQVDRNGQITAMGEVVKKVLVDGEEFFGSDPGIATKNLRADAVKEVQVFDKKSEQAEFTGIDDGTRDKTINLKMKDMTGYFGKIEAAGGLKDKFTNQAMINAFKGKRKLAAYGIMSNTGQTNLDWQDAQNYGGGSDNIGMTDDGMMYMSFGGGDDSYYGGRNGIPQNWNGGLHYSNKFNKDKLSLNSGYKFSKVNASGLTTTFSNTFLPDTSWITNTRNNTFSSTNKHAFNVTTDLNIDSSNSIRWATKFNNNNGISTSKYYSESLNDQSQFINNSTRNSSTRTDKNNVSSNLLWRHKFKKLSRTFSVSTDFNWAETKSDGLLYSLNNYFKNAVLDHKDTTDQQNIQDNISNSISSRMAYTEPITKESFLEINYTIAYYNNKNERITNTKNILNGKYENMIDTLSNSFVFNRLTNTPGINYRVNKKKYNYSFGSSVGFSNYVQKNITEGTKRNYNYTNFFPQANINYKLKSNANLRFYYNGSTNAPSLEQLQPTRVNTDPLNIYIGNPNLKQSFRHNLNGSYNVFNVLKEKNIFFYSNASITQNAFVQSSRIDSVGKRTYQTVNANGVYNFNISGNYGFKTDKSRIRFNFGPNFNVNRNIDFVNGVKNISKNTNYGFSFRFGKEVDKKYNIYGGPYFSWNHTTATVNKAANADYWTLTWWTNVNIFLPKNFELNTDVNLQARQKDPRFTKNSNYTTWNASVVKRMLKDNKLELSLSIFDILDQNKGYSRSFSSYSFTETYNTTLRRFWLLSVTWNLSKNGKPAGF